MPNSGHHAPADHLHDGKTRAPSRTRGSAVLAKSIERIGDHAKTYRNMSLHGKGRDVRHIGLDEIEKKWRSKDQADSAGIISARRIRKPYRHPAEKMLLQSARKGISGHSRQPGSGDSR